MECFANDARISVKKEKKNDLTRKIRSADRASDGGRLCSVRTQENIHVVDVENFFAFN